MLIKTKEQFIEALGNLSEMYPLKFRIDGYDVSLYLFRDNMQLTISVFVNGLYNPIGWMKEDCEIRRRFLQRKERYRYSKKVRDASKEYYGKKGAAKKGHLAKISTYEPRWRSIKKFAEHVLQENEKVIYIPRLGFFTYPVSIKKAEINDLVCLYENTEHGRRELEKLGKVG